MPAIVLHQWAISPFCGKVRRILEHKGLAYEIVNYNGLRARKASGLSHAGKLPVLDYDSERVQDSSDIAAFLERKHPERPIFPADPLLRAQAHFWEDWADESLYWFEVYVRFMYPDARRQAAALLSEGRPKLERAVLGGVLRGMYRKKTAAQGIGRLPPERVEAKLLEHVDALETLLGQRRWLVGEDRTIA
ncbi:MAG TPA: glutathione S-transferase family protein, partial [Kofleriaceae bacterium]|nr:glutathione S-transferase family protein [Kofleriaceae bacterium]